MSIVLDMCCYSCALKPMANAQAWCGGQAAQIRVKKEGSPESSRGRQFKRADIIAPHTVNKASKGLRCEEVENPQCDGGASKHRRGTSWAYSMLGTSVKVFWFNRLSSNLPILTCGLLIPNP
jgi:hypothetical protein